MPPMSLSTPRATSAGEFWDGDMHGTLAKTGIIV